uniref:Peroxidase n=1 Tax=Romanomermis culicivorax TaxID=13658 RepID=A0A915HIN3_ROMCU
MDARSDTSFAYGRDAGLAGYNDWRHFCGLSFASTFDGFAPEIEAQSVRDGLKLVYGRTEKVDLFVGGLLESPVGGGLVGPTVACLVADQFRRLREGDRFWYQNPGVFTPNQQVELERASLARVICDNGDDFRFTSREAFHLAGRSSVESCASLGHVNLDAWKETPE